MTLVLGVDGGGTRTTALVADERGAVLGAAVNGPSNWEDVGVGAAGAALRVAVDEAVRVAGARPDAIAASVFGLAGIDWPSDVERLGVAIDPLGLGGPVEVVNDAFIALRAGARDPWGVVVIAGTGSVVAGRSPAGEVFRTLGLGPLFGDVGSASEVSEDAVRAVAAGYVGRGPGTLLTELLCERFGCANDAELLEFLSRRPTHGRIEDDIENVAPIVVSAADQGDLVARDILERAGSALGGSAVLVARRLAMLDEEFDVVLSGGLITGASRFVSDPFETVVGRAAPRASFVHLSAPSVAGAVVMALEGAGDTMDAEAVRALSAEIDQAIRGLLDVTRS